MEHILGYRGFDTRNNLHFSADGHLVYHAAGAGIVHDTQTQQQTFYLEHTDDIICMCANQNPNFKVCEKNMFFFDDSLISTFYNSFIKVSAKSPTFWLQLTTC